MRKNIPALYFRIILLVAVCFSLTACGNVIDNKAPTQTTPLTSTITCETVTLPQPVVTTTTHIETTHIETQTAVETIVTTTQAIPTTSQSTTTSTKTQHTTTVTTTTKKLTQTITEGTGRKGFIKMTVIDQGETVKGPGLPTGCESTAMTTLLNFLGFDITKNQFVDIYLTKGETGKVDPNYAFPGNPNRWSNSYGAYAPAIAEATLKYLKEMGEDSNYRVEIYTDYLTGDNVNGLKFNPQKLDLCDSVVSGGLSFEEIKEEIDKGNPCVTWITTGKKPPRLTTSWTLKAGTPYTNDGEGTYTFTWVAPQHGVVIQGYDDDKQIVYIGDVYGGFTNEYTYKQFLDGYETFGRQTVFVKKK